MKVKRFVALLSVMVFLFVSVFAGTVSAVSDQVRSSRSSAILYLSDTAPTIRKEYMEAEFGPLRTIDYDVFLSATEDDIIAMIANGYFVNYNRNNRSIRDYGYVFVEFSRIKMDGMQLQTLFNQIRPNRDNGPTIIFVSAWDVNEFHCEGASITFFFDRFYKTHEDPFAHFVGDMLEDAREGSGNLEELFPIYVLEVQRVPDGTNSDDTYRQSFDLAAEHGRQLDGDEIEAFGTLRELLEGE